MNLPPSDCSRTPTPTRSITPLSAAHEMLSRRDTAESVASFGSRGFSEAGVDRRHRSASASVPAHVLTEDTDDFMVGQHVYVDGVKPGRIQYIGDTKFGPGDWAGVVLDEPMGKNDGSVSGIRYFQCEPGHGVFARLFRLTTEPIEGASEALSQMRRYGYEIATDYCPVHPAGRKGRRSSSRSISPSRSGTPEPRRTVFTRASPDGYNKVGPQESLTVPMRRDAGGSPLGRRSPFGSPPRAPRARITGGDVRIEKDPDMTGLTQEARRLSMADKRSTKRPSPAPQGSSYRRTSRSSVESRQDGGYYNGGRKPSSSSSSSRSYAESRRRSEASASNRYRYDDSPYKVDVEAERRRRSEPAMRRTTAVSQNAVLNHDTDSLQVGQVVWVDGNKRGRIAYIGGVRFTRGEVAGVHLDRPVGKNNGTVGGVLYFYCQQNHGIFARLHRLALEPIGQEAD